VVTFASTNDSPSFVNTVIRDENLCKSQQCASESVRRLSLFGRISYRPIFYLLDTILDFFGLDAPAVVWGQLPFASTKSLLLCKIRARKAASASICPRKDRLMYTLTFGHWIAYSISDQIFLLFSMEMTCGSYGP